MKRVLVTGAGGQLGKCIRDWTQKLKDDSFQFIFLDKSHLDISNKVLVETYFFSNTIDYCINCAAYTDVDGAESDAESAFKINSDGVKYLAEECSNQNAVLIHISTDYVFNGESDIPYYPTDPTNPINVYGKSKLEGEKWALGINPKSIIIRTSWLYSQYGRNFYTTMLKLMKERKEINVVSDQIGKPTNANDLAKYILDLIISGDNDFGVRHFTGPEQMSWYDFAKKIKKENGFSTKINPIPSSAYPTAAKRPKWSVLEN